MKGLNEAIAFKLSLGKLMNFKAFCDWNDAQEYIRNLAEVIFEMNRNSESDRQEKIIDKINSYINSHLSNDLSLVQLSEAVYMSPSYLSRFYKRSTGHKLSDYIDSQKIEKAVELLHIQDVKIYEIALAVGYENPGSFTRFFKKKMNMTPQEYVDNIIRFNKECE